MKNTIEKLINLKPKAIFIDCFDTIIHRTCHADDIIFLWAKIIITEFKLSITENELIKLRHLYFKKLTHTMHSPRLEDVCKSMYSTLSRKMVQEISIKEFVKYCIEVEINLEKKYQFLDKDIISILDYATENDIKCYVVSDFYLGKEYLFEFLDALSVIGKVEDIYVSCDYNARKAYLGNLYKVVCESLKLQPTECVMIGDNYISDYKNAKRNGLHAIYKRYALIINAHDKEWVNKRIWEIYSKYNKKNEFSLYAFPLFLFIERLYQSIVHNGIKDVLFFSREGQILKKMFDLYLQKIGDTSVKSYYVYISRLSSFQSGLKSLEIEDFHILGRQYPHMSIGGFLRNIGLFEYVEELEINKEDLESIVNCFFQSKVFKELKNNDIFNKLYEENRNKKNTLFREYINSLGVDLEKEIAVVDIGWKGTIQDNLFYSFNEKIKIRGFYIGLSDFGDASYWNKKNGLLWESFYKRNENMDHWEMLESYSFEALLQADHSQVVSYAYKDEFISPILANDGINSSYKRVEDLLTEIINVFTELLELFNSTLIKTNDVIEVFEIIQKKFVYKYSFKKTHRLINLCPINDYDSFGLFLRMNNSNMYLLLRAVKNYGFLSNHTFDRVLRSKNILIIVLYSKIFCLLKKII